MKKTIISCLAIVYVLLMLSTTVEKLCFEGSKKYLSVDLSECEDVTGENEEPASEDNRECEDDENIKPEFSYTSQKINLQSIIRASAHINLSGFHFHEIDSPPPQA